MLMTMTRVFIGRVRIAAPELEERHGSPGALPSIRGFGGDRLGSPPCQSDPGGADPAGLGDVDHHVVRTVVLHLDVGLVLAGHPDAEGAVDVVPGRGTPGGELFLDLVQVLDLEADVVDAAPALAALDAGHVVALEVEDGQVEVPIA